MSNERIDFRQLELDAGAPMTRGKWEVVLGDMDEGEPDSVEAPPFSVASCVMRQDVHHIAALPEIIAELKRCYEELDELRIGLNMAHRCLAAHNFRQCGECGDHYHDDYGPLCGHTASQ